MTDALVSAASAQMSRVATRPGAGPSQGPTASRVPPAARHAAGVDHAPGRRRIGGADPADLAAVHGHVSTLSGRARAVKNHSTTNQKVIKMLPCKKLAHHATQDPAPLIGFIRFAPRGPVWSENFSNCLLPPHF